MGLFDDVADVHRRDTTDDDTDATERDPADGTTASLSSRASEVEIAGETYPINPPETEQPDAESGNWMTGGDAYGVPRGIEAAENRQIVQTSAMQSIVNGIVDQLLGGDLVFLDNDAIMDDLSDSEQQAADRLRDILRDVLTGPHMGDEDLDDLVTAAVEDMLGVGNAYWQLLAPASGDLPVVSLTALDPLTIRHDFDEHGFPEDPPYWQAVGSFSGASVGQLGAVDPTPLQSEQLAVMRYPKGARSYRRYPVSAAWQVKEWLEILANSTMDHNRRYNDDEIPAGLLQVVGASNNTVANIKDKVQEASGDPRSMPVVGGEAPANWIEMNGTGVNLDVIGEQQWFYELCLGSLGLGKAEVGMIEDVNRANGQVEADRVYKRVAGPFGNQFEEAMLHIARQFETFTELGEPFTPTLANSDPRAEEAKRERLRQEYEAGKITLRQYRRESGDEDIAADEEAFTVEVNGQTVNYGDHPKWVAQRLMSQLGASDPEAAPDAVDEEQAARATRETFTDYPDAAVENAQMALDAREDTGNPNDCGTDVGWARANQLADREAISEETVRRMAAFRRHEENAEMDDDEGRADCGWMMWAAWGGEEGISWAERKVDQLEEDG